MAIEMNTFRNLADNINVVISGEGQDQTVQKAGIFQNSNSALNLGSSRATNQRVLDTLKQAIDSDPRYFGVKEHAKGLIDGIRTDRAIKSTQIKELVAYIDSISTPKEQQNVFMSRALSSMVQNPMSESMQGLDDGVKNSFATALKNEYKAIMQGDAQLAHVDIAHVRQNKVANMEASIPVVAASNLPENQKNTILTTVAKKDLSPIETQRAIDFFTQINDSADISERHKGFIRTAVFNNVPAGQKTIGDASFAESMTIRKAMTASDTFVAQQKAGNAIDTALQNLGFADATDIAEAKTNVLFQLEKENKSVLMQNRPLDAAVCQQNLHTIMQKYEACSQEITNNSDNPQQVHIALKTIAGLQALPKAGFFAAMHQACQNTNTNKFTSLTTMPMADAHKTLVSLSQELYGRLNQVPANLKPDNIGVYQGSTLAMLSSSVLSTLSHEQQNALFDKLSSGEMENLHAYYDEFPMDQEATGLSIVMNSVKEELAALLGRENPPLPEANKELVPTNIRSHFEMDSIFGGEVEVAHRPHVDATSYMGKVNRIADSLAQVAFQSDMVHLQKGETSTFEKDINRTLAITIGGQRVPNNFAAAKDVLAQFVTGQNAQRYADLNQADKAKTNILMAYCSQELEKGVMYAAAMAMNKEEALEFSITPSGKFAQQIRSFELEHTPDGGMSIAYSGFYEGGTIMMDQGQTTFVGNDTQQRYSANITVPGAELNRLAGLDWNALADAGVPRIPAAQMGHSRDILDENFCVDHTMKTNVQFNITASTEATLEEMEA